MSKISLEEGFEKGYLQRKIVYLKPVPRKGKLIESSTHVSYFQYEGASNWMALAKNNMGSYVNPFKSEEEREFFEERLGGTKLGIHVKEDNFWNRFYVKVKKDWVLMNKGYEFDLSDPLSNLRWRVLKNHPQIAPSWEQRFNRGEFRFALVDENYEIAKESNATTKLIRAYTYFGGIESSKQKMSDLLGMYLLETKSSKELPSDSSIEFLRKEVKKIIESDINKVIELIEDSNSKIKLFILRGLRANAIIKEGRNSYVVPGEGVKYMYNELVDYLAAAKENTDDIYLKIEAIIKMKK